MIKSHIPKKKISLSNPNFTFHLCEDISFLYIISVRLFLEKEKTIKLNLNWLGLLRSL